MSEADEIEDDPMNQLIEASRAVYRSWMGDRALTYRRLQGFDDLKGSAVMVQAMVFGNRGTSSGSGVAFSRDPSTGDPDPVIDVLFEAQGEDVVCGRARPMTERDLARSSPAIAAELRSHLAKLEQGFKDVQDVEFTIEDGRGERGELGRLGQPVILVRPDIDTADVAGLAAALGALTAMGGRTAHASLIARQMGKPCVVSCAGLEVNVAAHRAKIDGALIEQGDWVSIDGDSGDVFLGQREIVTERPEGALAEVETWCAAPPREDATALALAD